MKITGSKETSLALSDLFVTPSWLAQRLQHLALCLIDVREAASYEEGHIRGAVQLDLAALNRESDGVPGMLLSATDFAEQMGQLGINSQKTVVIYDDNWGLPAARVLWALARYGHKNVAVLNGGIDRWQEEDRPTTTESVGPVPAVFQPHFQDQHLATQPWLKQRLDDPNLVLLDTRSPGEFGAGHLPGAICWDWIDGVPMGSWDALRPADELRDEFAQLGVTPEKEVVTYCRSGARAAHTYLLLRYLGFGRVRLYDGSWLEWSRWANGDEKKEPIHDDET